MKFWEMTEDDHPMAPQGYFKKDISITVFVLDDWLIDILKTRFKLFHLHYQAVRDQYEEESGLKASNFRRASDQGSTEGLS
jgi:hypothetical protein